MGSAGREEDKCFVRNRRQEVYDYVENDGSYGRLNGPFKKILTSQQNIYLRTKKDTSFVAPSTGTLWHPVEG